MKKHPLSFSYINTPPNRFWAMYFYPNTKNRLIEFDTISIIWLFSCCFVESCRIFTIQREQMLLHHFHMFYILFTTSILFHRENHHDTIGILNHFDTLQRTRANP